MMRRVLIMLLMLVALLGFSASAQEDAGQGMDTDELYAEQWQASGADELWDDLPSETQELLSQWGISDFSQVDLTDFEPQNVLDGLWNMLSGQASGPLAACGLVIGIVLLCALMDGLRQGAGDSPVTHIFSLIGAIASYAAVLVPLAACIHRVCEAVESTSVFMFSYVPVYSGIMLASGQAVSASAYQAIVLFVAELLTLLINKVVVPFLIISLALGLTGSVAPDLKLSAAGGLFNKMSVWLLTITTSVFVGLLSMQGIVGAAADSLAGRAIRFSLASFVPVVGGALSEAFNSVKGCLSLLRTTMGGIGVLVTAVIVLPPLLECILWSFCLSLCAMAADMFSLPALGGLLRTAQSVVKTLIGVLAACSLFLIIATTIVTLAGMHA